MQRDKRRWPSCSHGGRCRHTLTGLVGVAFEKAVSRVQTCACGAGSGRPDHAFCFGRWPLSFGVTGDGRLLWCENLRRKRRLGYPGGALEELRPGALVARVAPVKFIGGMERWAQEWY